MPEGAWDFSDLLNPQPLVWPICSECAVPWHYCWAWDLAQGKTHWVWMRGCKHKKAQPKTYDSRPPELQAITSPRSPLSGEEGASPSEGPVED